MRFDCGLRTGVVHGSILMSRSKDAVSLAHEAGAVVGEPPGLARLFLGVTHGMTRQQRGMILRSAALHCCRRNPRFIDGSARLVGRACYRQHGKSRLR